MDPADPTEQIFIKLHSPDKVSQNGGSPGWEWDQIGIDFCSCSTRKKRSKASCRYCIANRRLEGLTADEAVSIIYQEKAAVTPIIGLIATATLSDKRYRRAGAAEAFIWRLSERPVRYGSWLYPILGLVNIMSTIYREQSRDQKDLAILKAIHSSYHTIVAHAFCGEQDDLFGDDGAGLRAVASKFICLVLLDPKMRSYVLFLWPACMKFTSYVGRSQLYSEITLSIVLACWLFIENLSSPFRRPVIDAALFLLTDKSILRDQGQIPLLHKISQGIDVSFSLHIQKILNGRESFDLADEDLLSEIRVIRGFVDKNGPPLFISEFTESDVHMALVEAMEKQVDLGSSERINEEILSEGFILLKYAPYLYRPKPGTNIYIILEI